jgi:hypothetical protein
MDLELYIEKWLSYPLGGDLVEVGALVTAPRIGQCTGLRVNPGSIDGSYGWYEVSLVAMELESRFLPECRHL